MLLKNLGEMFDKSAGISMKIMGRVGNAKITRHDTRLRGFANA
jgi:hypothetical protein